MMTRLSIGERLNILQEYRDKVFKLAQQVNEVLTEKFAPFDIRNYGTGSSAADGEHPYDDKDAPLMAEVSKTLYGLFEKLDKRAAEVDLEDDKRVEAQEMFYAWDLGLCPYVMRGYRRKMREIPDVWNSLLWPEIAAFLEEDHMSRKDTIRAVKTWQFERTETENKKSA